MEVQERPPVAEDKTEAELERFKGVVASRRFPSEFLVLFDKLRVSDMFSPEVKPRCFAYLVEQSAVRVPNHYFPNLLDAIEKSGAVATMYAGRGVPQAEVDFRAMVRRWFEYVPQEGPALHEVFMRAERMGISNDRGLTIALALEAGATMDYMDTVCDLTVYLYYPTLRMVAEKKTVPEAACVPV